MYGQAYKALVDKTKDTTGARVENNKFCLSVHFRCVDEKVILPRPAGGFFFTESYNTFNLVDDDSLSIC